MVDAATQTHAKKLLSAPQLASSCPPPNGDVELPEEILLEIVKYLSKPDITQVVRVSWAFWRIAVPLIWRDLEEVEGNGHLCCLLQNAENGSSGGQDADETSVGCNEATSPQRSTFHVHAHLVKSLTLLLCNEDDPFGLIWVLKDLGAQGATQLLPALEELRITVLEINGVKGNVGRALRVLMSPTITDFEINFDTDSLDEHYAWDASVALDSVLDLLELLQLRTFRISCTDIWLCMSEGISKMIGAVISQQQTLTSVSIVNFCSGDSPPFMEASALPYLETIHLEIAQADEVSTLAKAPSPIANPRQEASFPLLRHLITRMSPADAGFLVSSITHNNLSTLDLDLEAPQLGATLGTTLETLGRFEHLRTICIKYLHIHGTWSELRPVLSCHRMQIVSLRGDYLAAEVGDPQLRSMAVAWPLLESLDLADSHLERTRCASSVPNVPTISGNRYPPSATLMGLSAFASHCPSLTSITVPVDARGTLHDIPFEAIGVNVVHVRLPDSLVGGAEQQVAEFIMKMWPNLDA